jgi:phosphohistidine phosphatase SixA
MKMTPEERNSNAEFKAMQRDIKRQIKESGLNQEEWVERWLDTPKGQLFMALHATLMRNSSTRGRFVQ